MGAYMATPCTDKVSNSGYTDWFSFGVSSMQGWRIHQEDAHNCVPEFDGARSASLFAVYDGHGGSEVARYCANYLPDFLRSLPAYAKSDPAEALKQLFLDLDASLTTPEVRAILRSMADSENKETQSDDINGEVDDSDAEESDGEISALRAEATQPLESVLQRYGGEAALPASIKDLLDHRRRTKVGECSTAPVPSERAQRSSDSVDQPAPTTPHFSAVDDQTESSASKAESAQFDTDKTNPQDPSVGATTDQGPSSSPQNDAAEETSDDSDDESVELDAEADASEASGDDSDEEDEENDDDDDEEAEDEEDDDDDDETEDVGGPPGLRFGIPGALKDQEDNEPGVDSGTTACVALLLPMNGVVKLYVANAGDSRAVLCRGAAAVELSVDHKPDDEDEKCRITAAGGTVTRDGRVNGGLNLSRALGDHCYKQVPNLPLAEQMITPSPDVTQFDLIAGADDFLVIACDGVWNSMTSQEVVTFVYDRLHAQPPDSTGDKATLAVDPATEAKQLAKICEEIFDHCLAPNTEGDGTGCDNMTCIIVRFRDLHGLARLSPSGGVHDTAVAETRRQKRTANADTSSADANANGQCATHDVSLRDEPKRLKSDPLPTAAVSDSCTLNPVPVTNGGNTE